MEPGEEGRMKLGVNIDHVATLRQARGTDYPSPAAAVPLCLAGGADGITIHLREDRRHIRDADLHEIRGILREGVYSGPRLAGSLTGVVASKSVTEASKGALGPIGNRPYRVQRHKGA